MLDQIEKKAGAAHDVKGFLLRAGLALEVLERDNSEHIRRQACRISRALDQLSELCLREFDPSNHLLPPSDLLDAFQIKELLRDVVSLARTNASPTKAKIRFRLQIDPGASIQAPRSMLFRAFLNLVVNAVNAIDANKGTCVMIDAYPDNGMVKFDISDDGPGLPEHVLHALFPFVSQDAPRRGQIGLGLVIACNLATEMNGKLTLLQTGKDGTAFRFEIPSVSSSMSQHVGTSVNPDDFRPGNPVCDTAQVSISP